MNAGRCFLQTVAVLVLFTVARTLGLLGPPIVSVSLLTVALVLIARSAGATCADLGLDRADMRAGWRYGAGAFGIVLLVLLVAAVIPATNGFLHDSRAEIGGGRLLYELGVSIMLLTAGGDTGHRGLRAIAPGDAQQIGTPGNGRTSHLGNID